MTALTYWNPIREIEVVQSRLLSFWGTPPERPAQPQPDEPNHWSPRVDVIETPGEYVIRIDLPGVNRQGLNLTLNGTELTVIATRCEETLPQGGQYLFNERRQGGYTKTFLLPTWSSVSNIKAEIKMGVLTIEIRKTTGAKAHHIEITGD